MGNNRNRNRNRNRGEGREQREGGEHQDDGHEHRGDAVGEDFLQAGRAVKESALKVAAAMLQADATSLDLVDGNIVDRASGAICLPLAELGRMGAGTATFAAEAPLRVMVNEVAFAIPRGFFLPVTPGTRHVTLGGAIANDVHGKNHHSAGTFGRSVRRIGLTRSDRGALDLLQEDRQLQPRERRAEAEVHALAERDMARVAMDIEAIGLLVLALVAAGGTATEA